MAKPKISGKDLRILLIRKDLTFAELARRVGVSRSAITLLFQGKMESKATKEKVAKLLGVNVTDLFAA